MNIFGEFNPNLLPDSFYDQQYSRAAMYISHAKFLAKHLCGKQERDLKIIEFGGSNGFIKTLFNSSCYEVAPNAPMVDIHDLSAFPRNYYDFVILDEILEHVEKPWVAIEEIHQILKPGGCLITSSPFLIAVHKVPNDYWRFTKDGIAVLLKKFSTVETYSWGNPSAVTYLMKGMMVSVRDTINAGQFDLSNIEKFAISVWAYAWK